MATSSAADDGRKCSSSHAQTDQVLLQEQQAQQPAGGDPSSRSAAKKAASRQKTQAEAFALALAPSIKALESLIASASSAPAPAVERAKARRLALRRACAAAMMGTTTERLSALSALFCKHTADLLAADAVAVDAIVERDAGSVGFFGFFVCLRFVQVWKQSRHLTPTTQTQNKSARAGGARRVAFMRRAQEMVGAGRVIMRAEHVLQ